MEMIDEYNTVSMEFGKNGKKQCSICFKLNNGIKIGTPVTFEYDKEMHYKVFVSLRNKGQSIEINSFLEKLKESPRDFTN